MFNQAGHTVVLYDLFFRAELHTALKWSTTSEPTPPLYVQAISLSVYLTNTTFFLQRQLDGTLKLSLSDSTLKDQAGRTGYVAANYQFQFDAPPQAGALFTSGFSLCSNNSLALGGSAVWYVVAFTTISISTSIPGLTLPIGCTS